MQGQIQKSVVMQSHHNLSLLSPADMCAREAQEQLLPCSSCRLWLYRVSGSAGDSGMQVPASNTCSLPSPYLQICPAGHTQVLMQA